VPLPNTVNNLKNRPNEDKRAVAIGSAGAVVIVLIIGWAFIFLKNLRQEQVVSGQAFEIPPENISTTPVMQTYQSYNASQNLNQFGMPAGE